MSSRILLFAVLLGPFVACGGSTRTDGAGDGPGGGSGAGAGTGSGGSAGSGCACGALSCCIEGCKPTCGDGGYSSSGGATTDAAPPGGGGAPSCGPGSDGLPQKLCDGVCRSVGDPSVGCGGPSCAPCFVPHATAACGMPPYSCEVGKCELPYVNCNGSASDGCEANLALDANHCGACFHACLPGETCTNGSCHCTCLPGFLDCDKNCSNGCEANPSEDPSNCGGCGIKCGMGQACVYGQCS